MNIEKLLFEVGILKQFPKRIIAYLVSKMKKTTIPINKKGERFRQQSVSQVYCIYANVLSIFSITEF